MYRSKVPIMANNFPNKILPVLWVQAEAYLQDFAYDTLHLAFVLVPKLVDYGKIFTLLLALLFAALAFICSRRKAKVDYDLNGARLNLIRPNDTSVIENHPWN
uniref:Uncharacterized protein n=1 Tax=Acrobeloides nanus TaxID=290746 RepID=A0A914DD71_9BILA